MNKRIESWKDVPGFESLFQISNFGNLSVDHINRDSLDNRVENLRWVTPKENNDNRGGKFENGRH